MMTSNDLSAPEAKYLKFHSLGILSIVIGAVSLLTATSLFAVILFSRWNLGLTTPIVLYLGVLSLAIVGIGLGIGSLIRKGSKKILGILGCTLNSLTLLIFYLPIALAIIINGGLGIRDGCVFGTAKTWIDQNENGVWDSNEIPIGGVQFEVINNQQEQEFVDEITSDENGTATLLTFPYTCDSLHGKNLVIRVTPPNGFRATTSEQVIISGDELPHMLGRTYLFGFSNQSWP